MREGWTYKKLGEVCEVEYGTRVVQARDGGSIYPVYGGGGATFMMDTYNRENRVVVSRFAMSKKCTRKVIGKFFLNDSGLTIKSKEPLLLQNYLDTFILSSNDKIYHLGRGLAQKNLKVPDLLQIDIAIPNAEVQQFIASELDKINELISLKKAQLSDLDALAQSIFYDMFGDPIENEKGWEVKKLGEVSVFPSKRVNIADLTPSQYIGVENLRKDKKGVEFSQTLPNADKAIEFITDDILIGNIRPYLRKIWISNINGGASGDVIIVRKNTPSIMPMYLFKVLSTETFFEYDNANTHGAKMPRGDKKIIELFPIPLPPLSLQQDFTKRIELIEQQKAQISSTIKDLETLLASRMQYWFD